MVHTIRLGHHKQRLFEMLKVEACHSIRRADDAAEQWTQQDVAIQCAYTLLQLQHKLSTGLSLFLSMSNKVLLRTS